MILKEKEVYNCEEYKFELEMELGREKKLLKDLRNIYLEILSKQECPAIRYMYDDISTRLDNLEKVRYIK